MSTITNAIKTMNKATDLESAHQLRRQILHWTFKSEEEEEQVMQLVDAEVSAWESDDGILNY